MKHISFSTPKKRGNTELQLIESLHTETGKGEKKTANLVKTIHKKTSKIIVPPPIISKKQNSHIPVGEAYICIGNTPRSIESQRN